MSKNIKPTATPATLKGAKREPKAKAGKNSGIEAIVKATQITAIMDEIGVNGGSDAPDMGTTVLESTPAKVDGFKPHQKATSAGFAPRVMGFLGYGKGTGTELMAQMLCAEDGATKAEIIAAYISATGKQEKAAKTTLSVFLSDAVRPFGRYYASRSLALLSDGERFKFDPATVEMAQAAVAAGALSDLKTIAEKNRTETHPQFVNFLKKHGFGKVSE